MRSMPRQADATEHEPHSAEGRRCQEPWTDVTVSSSGTLLGFSRRLHPQVRMWLPPAARPPSGDIRGQGHRVSGRWSGAAAQHLEWGVGGEVRPEVRTERAYTGVGHLQRDPGRLAESGRPQTVFVDLAARGGGDDLDRRVEQRCDPDARAGLGLLAGRFAEKAASAYCVSGRDLKPSKASPILSYCWTLTLLFSPVLGHVRGPRPPAPWARRSHRPAVSRPPTDRRTDRSHKDPAPVPASCTARPQGHDALALIRAATARSGCPQDR
ncbi:hypothetical protein EDD92_0773 [Streptomyces sp. TLI_185]|nr:hypothetical protein EDD92_0773 [Streptomyces sp. TLI_185]